MHKISVCVLVLAGFFVAAAASAKPADPAYQPPPGYQLVPVTPAPMPEGYKLVPISQPSSQAQPVGGTAFNIGAASMDIWTSYVMLSMSKFNTAMIDCQETYFNAYHYTTEQKLTKFTGGVNGGLDFNFALTPNLKIGPRIEFLYAFPAEVSGVRDHLYAGGYYSNYSYRWKLTTDAWLIPITAGLAFSTQSPGPVNFTFGANAGLALAYATLHSTYSTDDPNDPASDVAAHRYDLPISAKGPFAKFLARMNVATGPDSAFFIKLGYQLADFSSLTVNSTLRSSFPFGRVNEGTTARDFTGASLDLDFSGLEAGIGFQFGI